MTNEADSVLKILNLTTNNQPDQRAKKRLSYEDVFAEKEGQLNRMNLQELRKAHQDLIAWLDNLDVLLKEPGIKESRRQYLIGLRNRVVRPLLTALKNRRKTINRVIHNSVSKDFAQRFVEVAAEQLPMEQFQRIYGVALTAREVDQQKIEDVKQFMQEARAGQE